MPRSHETETRSESAPKEKRKPIRRDPEKRRQQNLAAQRKYRECTLFTRAKEPEVADLDLRNKETHTDV